MPILPSCELLRRLQKGKMGDNSAHVAEPSKAPITYGAYYVVISLAAINELD